MSTKTEDTVSTVAVELSEKRNEKDEKETSAKRAKGFHIGHAGGAYGLGLKGEYIHTPGDVFNSKPVFRKFWGFPPVQRYIYYTESNKWMATDRRKDFPIGAGVLLSKQQCCPSPLEVEDWTIYDKAEKKWKVEHDFELTVHEHHLKLCGMCENENDDEVEYIKGNLFELRTEYKSVFDGNTDLCEHCWNKLDVEKKKQYAKIETPKDLPEFGWTDPARRREDRQRENGGDCVAHSEGSFLRRYMRRGIAHTRVCDSYAFGTAECRRTGRAEYLSQVGKSTGDRKLQDKAGCECCRKNLNQSSQMYWRVLHGFGWKFWSRSSLLLQKARDFLHNRRSGSYAENKVERYEKARSPHRQGLF